MKDEMRERLRLLLLEDVECGRRPCSTCPYNYSDDACFEHMSGLIADNLIENGVILLPCKVGDKVYVINEWKVEKTTVFSMKIESQDSRWITFLKAKVADHGIKFKDGYESVFKTFIFGKTAFLTKEKAEAHLPQPPKGE